MSPGVGIVVLLKGSLVMALWGPGAPLPKLGLVIDFKDQLELCVELPIDPGQWLQEMTQSTTYSGRPELGSPNDLDSDTEHNKLAPLHYVLLLRSSRYI